MSEAILDAPEVVEAPKRVKTLLELLSTDAGFERVVSRLKIQPHPLFEHYGFNFTRQWCFEFVAQHGDEKFLAAVNKIQRAIELEQTNPFYYGFESPQWKDADDLLARYKVVLITGSRRSSKTEYCAKRTVQDLVKTRGWKNWCFSTSSETSVRDQQQYVWRYIPYHWKKQYTERRNVARSKHSTMTFTQAKGFGDNRVFTTPNGGECRFMNYEQSIKVIEGGSIDRWWADEEIPPDWIAQLRWRTIDRRGKGVISYTPQAGFTPTLAEFFNGARVLSSFETPYADLKTVRLWPGLPRGHAPYVMECLDQTRAIIFFQAAYNPYVPKDEFEKSLEGLVQHVKALRAHGVTQKISGNCFPRFGRQNIISHEKAKEALEKPCTRYHVLDFAWNRNWPMLWAAVQKIGNRKRIIIYREWPDGESYGEWVVASDKPDGARGPAQQSLGYGINDYKRLVQTLETGPDGKREEIYARYGDPRSGAAQNMQEEGSTSIFEMLDGTDDGLSPLLVEPVISGPNEWHITEGVNLINKWLEYNPDQPIVPLLNEPMLYISDKCANLIACMKMWTGLDKDKGASKDMIDLLRYLAMMDIDYVPEGGPLSRKKGAY